MFEKVISWHYSVSDGNGGVVLSPECSLDEIKAVIAAIEREKGRA